MYKPTALIHQRCAWHRRVKLRAQSGGEGGSIPPGGCLLTRGMGAKDNRQIHWRPSKALLCFDTARSEVHGFRRMAMLEMGL